MNYILAPTNERQTVVLETVDQVNVSAAASSVPQPEPENQEFQTTTVEFPTFDHFCKTNTLILIYN